MTKARPRRDRERPLRVLHSLAAPNGTTRYVDHMAGSATPSVETVFYTSRTALLGRYDVFHVHWPELLVRGGAKQRWLARALLLRLRISRRPIVRTLHNVEPHEGSSADEAKLISRFDDETTLFIRLNPATPVPPGALVRDIPHPDYRTAYADLVVADRVPGRLAYVGLIRPYKNVAGLLDAFAVIDRADLSLSVSGNPSPALRDDIERRAALDPRVSLTLGFVPDADIVRDVTSAELIVLPYSQMHNSGILLVALSLGRPALVPASPSNQALADEVGDGWVLQYEGELMPSVLAQALDDARRTADLAPPRLDGRSWPAVGALHEQAYRDALTAARMGRR